MKLLIRNWLLVLIQIYETQTDYIMPIEFY